MIRIGSCLLLVGLVGRVSAQPVPEPDPPPPPVPEPVPMPGPDPLAAAMTQQAHSAALRADCEAVEKFAFRVRSLDPDLYRQRFATDAVILACDPRPARQSPTEGPRDHYHVTGFTFGFALAIGRTIDTNLQPFSGLPPTLPITPLTRTYVGYQGEHVAIGAQLQFGHDASTDSSTVMPVTTSTTTLLFGPAIRAQLWQSKAARAELLFAADVGFGETWTSVDPLPIGSVDLVADLHVAVRAGFGLRYWLAPAFALGVTTSLGVDYLEINESSNPILDAGTGPVNTVNSTMTTVDTALELVGVF